MVEQRTFEQLKVDFPTVGEVKLVPQERVRRDSSGELDVSFVWVNFQ